MSSNKDSFEISPLQRGIAGEYFVAGELTRRGFVASLTLRNTRGIDIIASSEDASRSVAIQVKTTRSDEPSWIMNKRAESGHTPKFFYILVRLSEVPAYYVVPSADVAKFCRARHAAWLAAPGRGGRAHRDSNIRKFKDIAEKYRDRWDLLGLDVEEKGG
jgi:hypothetical protein